MCIKIPPLAHARGHHVSAYPSYFASSPTDDDGVARYEPDVQSSFGAGIIMRERSVPSL